MNPPITVKHLESLIERLNTIAGEKPQPYDTTKTENRANVGTYFLDGAYGGWQLARIHNERGGQSQPLGGGFDSKRETYQKIRAFIHGFEAAREVKK
jgi:hypothetical protein